MSGVKIISTTKLLEYDEDTIRAILKKYNRLPSDLQDDLEVMKRWIKEQPHLPYCPSDRYILSFLLLNKFSIEKAKRKLDMSMTMQSLIPEYYEGMYPSTPEIRRIHKHMYFIPLPKMSKQLTRVTVCVLKPMENVDICALMGMLIIIIEMLIILDGTDCHEYIVDFTEATFDVIKRIRPMDVRRMTKILEEVYSNRVSAYRIINLPSYAEWILILFKSLLKPKLRDRIHVHHGYESLQDHYAKEMLPVEFGGTERSLAELRVDWQKLLDDHDEYFRKARTMHVDESKRPEKLANDDILGFHGNFRRLDVD